VLALLELLQAHHVLGGRELAGRLGVDERTVRRYASTLAELGIPVSAARGRYGGYRLRPGYKLPPLMFTDDEAVAVVLGLLAARRLALSGDAAGGPAVESAMAKLRRVLPDALAGRVAALGDVLEFTASRPGRAAPADTGTLLALAEAVADRRRVRLDYRSFHGRPSARDLDPYGLVFHAGRWYVTGHDGGSGEVRTFRVDRVLGVTPGGPTFRVPAGFDPVGQVVRGLAEVPYAWTVEVVLETDLPSARERIPASVGRLTEVPGGVLLRARAEHLDGVAQMLAGWPFPFTIISPAELRPAVAALAARLASYASARLRRDG
jgi:predicted DNA-binding transcriptional regulator YafY